MLTAEPVAIPVAPESAAIYSAVAAQPAAAEIVSAPPVPPAPTIHSEDGRFVLTDSDLTVRGQRFLLLELERADVMRVSWILWYLLGGLGLAAVMIAFLQNWLHTLPAMGGMAATALLLLYGRRGTNRLRLFRLGRETVNMALPGETLPWQRLTAELNRRIGHAHDRAAAEAAALLAAAETARQAELAANTPPILPDL